MQKGPQRELRFAQSVDSMLQSLQRIERHAGSIENVDDESSAIDETRQYVGHLEEKLVGTLEKEDKLYEAVIEELFQPDRRPPPEEWRSTVSREREDVFHSLILKHLDSEVPNEINRREEAIFEPYQETFSWIFQKQPTGPSDQHEPSASNFPAWLESDNKSPFWVTGKPGSGKSTLMKFIVHSPELERHLKRWAGDFPLQITSFYAWVTGTKLQNSALGFMRTILYKCIHSSSPKSDLDSNLASAVAPRRWALFATLRNLKKQPPWEDWELEESFNLLLTEVVKRKRVVLFVDGLDEFKLLPADTLAIIRGLCARDGIKVCVASRPWLEFNDALDSFPMLRMQDLTTNDMKKFVTGSFNNNRGFKEQRQVFPEQVDALVQEVVDKANGVFLWSRIVVRDLVQGFTEGDNLPKLAGILRSLPEDVDDLYTRIWRSIVHTRKSDFARLVALRRAAFEAPDYLTVWFADGGSTLWLAGGGHSQRRDIRTISKDNLRNLRRQVVRRLDSATRGILELSPTNKVDFLHRTAVDWVAQDDIWKEVNSHLDLKFNPSLRLLQAEALLYIDHAATLHARDRVHHVHGAQVLHYAHRVGNSPTDKEIAVNVLETFEKGLLEVGWTGQSSGCSNFFDLMCCYCALPYLEAKLSIAKSHLTGCSLDRVNASPLELAVFGDHSLPSSRDRIPLNIRRATVKLLLARGAPAKMREAVRLKVRHRQAKTTDEFRQRYYDDVLALLAAEYDAEDDMEDKKRGKMSRLLARVLRDKSR